VVEPVHPLRGGVLDRLKRTSGPILSTVGASSKPGAVQLERRCGDGGQLAEPAGRRGNSMAKNRTDETKRPKARGRATGPGRGRKAVASTAAKPRTVKRPTAASRAEATSNWRAAPRPSRLDGGGRWKSVCEHIEAGVAADRIKSGVV
jgi:hypothetical protein